MTEVTWSVEAAWSGQLTGIFTVDVSLVGGTDVIGGMFGGNAFDDISADVKSLSFHRGRSSDMAAMDQGECTLVLRDVDGTYNPENAASSLNGLLLPMRPIRVRRTYGGTTYGAFSGYVKRIRNSPNAYASTILAVDLFEWLARSKPVIAELTDHAVDDLIQHILDAIGWTDPTLRSIEAGGSLVPAWSADGSKDALTLIRELLTIDLGMFFIDGDGIATYLTRNTRYANGTSIATLDGTILGSCDTEISADTIINGQTVTRTGGTAQTATNAASRLAYGYRDGGSIESAYLDTDGQALSLAEFIVATNATPRPPARQVTIVNGDETRLLQQLTREIGDLVTIDDPKGGSSFLARIQALSETASEVGKIIETTYTVDKVTVSVFVVGISLVGGTDVISY